MIDSEEARAIDKGMKTLHLIWGAMLFSLAVYLFAGIHVANTFPMAIDAQTLGLLRNAFLLISVVTLGASKLIRALMLKKMPRGSYRETTGRHPVLGRYAIAMIVSLALAESIGLYGLVLVLLGSNLTDLYVLTLVSALAMFYYRPKKDEILSLVPRGPESF